MHNTLLLFIFSLIWSFVVLKQCKTPFGIDSSCVSLYACPELQSAFYNRRIPKEVENFLNQSLCGRTQEDIPDVCCGSLPTPQVRVVQQDKTVAADSFLAPQDQCGIDKQGDKIYGGSATELDEYPWMARLGYLNSIELKLTYQCGGMVLNNRYVLTAAHCLNDQVQERHGKLLTVRLGEYDTRTDIDCMDGVCASLPQDIPVLAAYIHERYNANDLNMEDDIGLIRLARRATFSYFVQPICLVKAGTSLDDETDVVTAGWGQIANDTYSAVKIKLHLPIFNKNTCDFIYREIDMNLTQKQICAGGVSGQGACFGDSGGPLMFRRSNGIWEAVGIVSNGIDCGVVDVPEIYTSIAHYLEWIQLTMISTNK